LATSAARVETLSKQLRGLERVNSTLQKQLDDATAEVRMRTTRPSCPSARLDLT
jgi:hypothetical protein